MVLFCYPGTTYRTSYAGNASTVQMDEIELIIPKVWHKAAELPA